MECPHCHQTWPSLVCQRCGGETPEESLYCCKCGSRIEKARPREEDDFSNRQLCSDGTCIGVINEKGVCNVCGKAYAGESS